ncbi:MAG: PilZ domain-containing protein [Candidatus Omnitrophica bacterium]|nr:PilZ domain-containing protein [Candidatus Omnitrophota bacterium]
MHQRKLHRRHLIYYLRVFNQQSGVMLGHLVDITPDGVMLVSETAIAVGAKYQCEMVLPQEISGTKKVCFEARSVWTKQDINPDFFATGFEIRNISEKDIDLIGTLVDRFGFKD